MRTSGGSEDDLKKAARRKLPKAGWYDGDIEDAVETTSQAGNDMFKCTVSFLDLAGEKWSLTVYLLDTPKTGLLLRHACAARGVLAKFEVAKSVDQSDLPGPVRLKIRIRKQRGWPDKLEVEDFAPAESSVVPLRVASGPDGRA
jgi:hypothetical protein